MSEVPLAEHDASQTKLHLPPIHVLGTCRYARCRANNSGMTLKVVANLRAFDNLSGEGPYQNKHISRNR